MVITMTLSKIGVPCGGTPRTRYARVLHKPITRLHVGPLFLACMVAPTWSFIVVIFYKSHAHSFSSVSISLLNHITWVLFISWFCLVLIGLVIRGQWFYNIRSSLLLLYWYFFSCTCVLLKAKAMNLFLYVVKVICLW